MKKETEKSESLLGLVGIGIAVFLAGFLFVAGSFTASKVFNIQETYCAKATELKDGSILTQQVECEQ